MPSSCSSATGSSADARRSRLSVSGEFQRAVRECLGQLEASPVGGAGPWQAALSAAAQLGREDLSAGAAQWLDAGAALPVLPEFALPLDEQRFRESLDHLARICRVILGR